MKMENFRRVLELFRPLGITRYVTSQVDYVSYPKVKKRAEAFGMVFEEQPKNQMADFLTEMRQICLSQSSELDVCCKPEIRFSQSGCIDGRLFNRLKGSRGVQCTTILHNRIGRQRPRCLCTYSNDIGYSRGVRQCFSQGSGCVYCYSQPQNPGAHFKKKLMEALREK